MESPGLPWPSISQTGSCNDDHVWTGQDNMTYSSLGTTAKQETVKQIWFRLGPKPAHSRPNCARSAPEPGAVCGRACDACLHGAPSVKPLVSCEKQKNRCCVTFPWGKYKKHHTTNRSICMSCKVNWGQPYNPFPTVKLKSLLNLKHIWISILANLGHFFCCFCYSLCCRLMIS